MNSQVSDMIVNFLIVHHAATVVLLALSFWGSHLALGALKSFDDTLKNQGSARANKPPEAMAVKRPPSSQSPASAMPHL